jgi:integrase
VTGLPVSERSVNLALTAAKKAAGMDDRDDRLSTYAFRHTFVSLAATNLDVPDTTLARLAGHANAAVTMRLYARDRRDQAEMNRDVLARAAQAGFAE